MPKNPDEIGALWEKSGQKGPYMTGTINGQAVVVFRNTFKTEGSQQPDWRILKSKSKEEREASAAGYDSSPVPDDDITF